MAHRKDILTTGEVARICHVAPRTVSKWFDSGQLRGYRIPGSKDRRIPVDHLLRFMAAHGIPTDNIVVGPEKVLILDSDIEFAEALKRALEQRRYEAMIAESSFEAGALVQVHKPNFVIIDIELPDVHPSAICRFFQSASELQSSMLVAIASGMTPSMGESLLQQGFAGYLPKPFTLDALLAIIQPVEVG